MLDHRSWLHRLLEKHPWLILASFVVGFSLLGMIMVRVDQGLQLDPNPEQLWLYGGSADAAMSLLSAVSSSAITVAGVVFSATFVTMQLASSQYTPRVVRALGRRWALQIVLGMFLGSFIYSLMVLRSVRPAGVDNGEFVPVLSVSVAIVIAIASVGVLCFYIIYGMRSLEPTFLINSAAEQTRRLLQRSLSASRRARSVEQVDTSHPPDENLVAIRAERAGYLQVLQFDHLLAAACRDDVTVKVTTSVGRYCHTGEVVALAWPSQRVSAEAERRFRQGVWLGDERTAEQDIEFGFRRVADIMLKALSPAINDPTTAQYCINTLGDLVILVANEREPQRYLVDDSDMVRVIWEPEPYDLCVHTAFDQLRFYVRNDTKVATHALDTMRRVHALIPVEAQCVVQAIAREFQQTVRENTDTEDDQRAIDRAASWLD